MSRSLHDALALQQRRRDFFVEQLQRDLDRLVRVGAVSEEMSGYIVKDVVRKLELDAELGVRFPPQGM